MTKILQKEILRFNCPHCKNEMNEAWLCELNSIIGLRFAYICSNCEKLLGVRENPVSVPIQSTESKTVNKNWFFN